MKDAFGDLQNGTIHKSIQTKPQLVKLQLALKSLLTRVNNDRDHPSTQIHTYICGCLVLTPWSQVTNKGEPKKKSCLC
jgi:hypothetical protein